MKRRQRYARWSYTIVSAVMLVLLAGCAPAPASAPATSATPLATTIATPLVGTWEFFTYTTHFPDGSFKGVLGERGQLTTFFADGTMQRTNKQLPQPVRGTYHIIDNDHLTITIAITPQITPTITEQWMFRIEGTTMYVDTNAQQNGYPVTFQYERISVP